MGMNAKQYCFSIAILACISALPASANTHRDKVSHSPKIPPAAKRSDRVELPSQVNIANQPTVSNRGNIANKGKFSLSPLPVDIYLRPNDKPTVAFTTPCIMVEKATHGFPPILAFETFMFQVIGNVNESNMLPARLEPVCV
jgi:hypothetical protein